MVKAICQSCESEITISSRPEIGQIVHCPRCNVALEVVWLYPIALDFVVEQLLEPDLQTK